MKEIICNLCGQDNYRLVCYGKDRLLKTDDTKFKVVQCKSCALVYINPQPEPHELSRYYPDSYGSYAEEKEVFRYSRFARFIQKLLGSRNKKSQIPKSVEINIKKETHKYLDFGCGGSRNLENVKRSHPHWKLYALDNNPTVCQQVEKKGFHVFCGDIAEVELPKNFFDFINMSSIIEHVYDPMYTMTKLHESLEHGGVVIIRTPNYNSIARALFKKYWVFIDSPRHLFLFTRKTLTRLLSETGFNIEEVKYLPNSYAEIKSYYYFINKKDRRISPITWRVLRPITYLFSKLGMSSTMIIKASKIN